MKKVKELLTLTELVYSILALDKKARNSDTYLYYKVPESQARKKGIDIDSMSITDFFLKSKELGFAHFESVRRTRQKLQAKHSFLSASEEVQEYRAENEVAFREFARSKV